MPVIINELEILTEPAAAAPEAAGTEPPLAAAQPQPAAPVSPQDVAAIVCRQAEHAARLRAD
jgi:hypothetical protein